MKKRSLLPLRWALIAALTSMLPSQIAAQDHRVAIGQYYRVSPPLDGLGRFQEVQIERIGPPGLTVSPPVQPLPVPVILTALTGQILEIPDRQRIYLTGLDSRGGARLLEVDLLTREVRQVPPQPDIGLPYAAHLLVAPQAAKLYVQWFASGFLPRTDIYDGQTLNWLGYSDEFRPDERAAGFEQEPPFLWTLDLTNRPVLVDTGRDRVVGRFDHQRWFGPVSAVTADASHDLLLFRLEVGHDRYVVVDVASGEVGPPLDLKGYRPAQARLLFSGRVLVLLDLERLPSRRGRPWSETATTTGTGMIFDLQNGRPLRDFRLAVPFDLPVKSVGTSPDPGAPGRLWIHVPGDRERIDLPVPNCDRSTPRGDSVRARLDFSFDREASRFSYRVSVAPDSPVGVAAMALKAGRAAESTDAPSGWGVDLIDDGRWVRWTNALGPVTENIAPGQTGGGFTIAAAPDSRPLVGEYRVQGAIGLGRGCERDDRFLKNSASGWTVVPEIVEPDDADGEARRLEKLLDRVCEIGWLTESACPSARAAARAIRSEAEGREVALTTFLNKLGAIPDPHPGAFTVLSAGAEAVREALRSTSR